MIDLNGENLEFIPKLPESFPDDLMSALTYFEFIKLRYEYKKKLLKRMGYDVEEFENDFGSTFASEWMDNKYRHRVDRKFTPEIMEKEFDIDHPGNIEFIIEKSLIYYGGEQWFDNGFGDVGIQLIFENLPSTVNSFIDRSKSYNITIYWKEQK